MLAANRTRDFCLSLPLPNHRPSSNPIFDTFFPPLLNSSSEKREPLDPISTQDLFRELSLGASNFEKEGKKKFQLHRNRILPRNRAN